MIVTQENMHVDINKHAHFYNFYFNKLLLVGVYFV
jgi:hypothetical protein